MSKEAIAIKALEVLARLGNGDKYGNSTGNTIARTALAEISRLAEQPAPVQPEQEPLTFEEWYDDAIWGNEDFKQGCRRSWNAAIKYTTQPAAPVQPVTGEKIYLDDGPEWNDRFDAWWEDQGQFCRAGGGDYEKTFAFRAYEAALANPPAAPAQPAPVQKPVATMRMLHTYGDTTPPAAAQPEQEPVLDDADMLLIRRSHVKRAITCLNTAENADLRLVLRDLFALLKTPPAPVQPAYGQKPDAFALRTKKHGLEFNSGYGMVKTLEQAQEMRRRHMGNLEIVELRATPPAAQRQWVGLTDERVKEIWLKGKDYGDDWLDVLALARSFEAELKELNT